MSSIQLSTALLNGALGEIDSTVWNEQEGETREGSLHFCQGPLRRKRHRAQAKVNKWKQKWFRVEPARRGKGAYQLTEYQGDEQPRMAKLILPLPASGPGTVRAASLASDAASQDYTAFGVHDGRSGELLSVFRAEDIVAQRRFMAALGATGPGLFSQQPRSQQTAEAGAATSKPSDTSLLQLVRRQAAYNARTQSSQQAEVYKNVPRTFQEALQKFPSEYYFPSSRELPPLALPGVSLQEYDPSQRVGVRALTSCRKVVFRPPHGPITNYPSIIGSGAAVELEQGQMAVWDQENEIYYFVDSNQKLVTANDLRRGRKVRQQVKKTQITVHKGQSEDSLELPECDPGLIRAAAQRAASKPHGCIMKAGGKRGRHGMSVIPAADGQRGTNGLSPSLPGASGTDGGDGVPGDDARHAEPGEDGGPGKNVIVQLYGDAKELGIDGTCQSVARLGGEECEAVLLVDCSGGDGSDGGVGGRGGRGGDGGHGGRGSEGGHGGAGGHGGRGGSGGSAGSGGRGGNCLIRAADPRLLMLVEVDCDSGHPGQPGRGGRGGSGGDMGLGGASSSPDGLQGKPGRSGDAGEDGPSGEPGFTHRPGNLQWVITDESGEETHSATTRFEAEVLSMKLTSSGQQDVFQPHQQIQVTDIVVVNSGGLPLPAGATISIPSTETVQFDPTTFHLPGLEPGEQFVVPTIFCGRIADEPSPNNPGPLNHEARFAPRIDLLGRPFDKSRLEQHLVVRYPVKLGFALAKKNICSGEVTTLEVGIENSSSTTVYGTVPSSGGSVLVHVLLDPRLHPLGLTPSDGERKFTASYDPNFPGSLFILVKELTPGATLSVPIVVRLEGEVELGETLRWQTELYLRGKLIEYSFSDMRAAPAYGDLIESTTSSAQPLGDVLLIKLEAMGEKEMSHWQRIFELLEVSYDYWDSSSTAESNSSSTAESLLPPFSEEYRGRMIVYPHCDLSKLISTDIVSHFRDTDMDGQKISRDSSMLLFLDTPSTNSLENHVNSNKASKAVLRHLCASEPLVDVPQELYSGRHLVSPGTILPVDWTLQRAQKTVLKKLERDAPSYLPVITGQSSAVRRQGMSYSYGKLSVRRCPIPRSANFQCVDGAVSNMIQMGADDPCLTETSREIPLASNFGQVFLSTLAGLPFNLKLKLVRQSLVKSSPLFVQFCLPNGVTLTKRELAAICLARDTVDEALSDTPDFQHIHTLTRHMKEVCTSDQDISVQLLDLIIREVSERQLMLGKSQFSQPLKHVLDICSSMSAEVSTLPGSKPHPLPLLSLLQDSLAVLRPHQLTTDQLSDISSHSH